MIACMPVSAFPSAPTHSDGCHTRSAGDLGDTDELFLGQGGGRDADSARHPVHCIHAQQSISNLCRSSSHCSTIARFLVSGLDNNETNGTPAPGPVSPMFSNLFLGRLISIFWVHAPIWMTVRTRPCQWDGADQVSAISAPRLLGGAALCILKLTQKRSGTALGRVTLAGEITLIRGRRVVMGVRGPSRQCSAGRLGIFFDKFL
ncbi:hypothetical protein B0T14DRAFT_158605 [Immersiella caudata]|uniref:Uncharacterized protein n=1 Tax=Immersiella caudata TaxID=314043 RepID=A0AA39WWR7_9PEZI|nr:hypothetical protein B0T14DRAFT_158605 [Immersiella caudata]